MRGAFFVTDTSRPNLQLFLNRLTTRSILSDEERQAILNLPNRASQVQSNRDFVRIGERVDHCCLIVAGMMGRFGQTSDGARQITALHVPGDIADLHSVVRPVGTSAIQALSTTTVLRIRHEELRKVAARFPAVAEAFWRDCVVDAAVLSQWVVNVGRRDSKTRMAHLLCEMAVRIGDERTPQLSYAFPVTQSHLADATGLTAVHVNRTLKALRDQGLVNVRGGTVEILDWDRLTALGEFNADYLDADTAPDARRRLLN
jgi:CRP-like cAMP-binding protein